MPKIDEEDSGTGQQDRGSLELPWLQAVKDKAVLPTTGLDAQKVEPQAPEEAKSSSQAQRTNAEAQEEQPRAQPVEAEKPPEPADAPPPTWVVSILEPSATPPPAEGSYESEELAHIMPWVHGAPEGEAAQEAETEDGESSAKTPGLPPWLGDVTVQETLQSVPKQEPMHGDLTDFDVEGIEPFALPDEVKEDVAPAVLPDFMRHVDMANAANRPKDATQPAPVEAQLSTIAAPLSNLEEMVGGTAVH
ncbi:MAG: hypothetical protein ABJA50_07685, partial [Chloroflexota bacterium]